MLKAQISPCSETSTTEVAASESIISSNRRLTLTEIRRIRNTGILRSGFRSI